jgi:hypothetical protein
MILLISLIIIVAALAMGAVFLALKALVILQFDREETPPPKKYLVSPTLSKKPEEMMNTSRNPLGRQIAEMDAIVWQNHVDTRERAKWLYVRVETLDEIRPKDELDRLAVRFFDRPPGTVVRFGKDCTDVELAAVWNGEGDEPDSEPVF